MSKADFNAAVRLLPNLSSAELAQLRASVSAFINTGSNGVGPAPSPSSGGGNSPDIDWLLEGFYHALRVRGLFGRGDHLPSSMINQMAPGFAVGSHAARALVLSKFKTKPNMAGLMRLGQVCGVALADMIAEWPNAPLGVQIMLRQVNRVPEALEASYPGYLRAGLLGLMINTKG